MKRIGLARLNHLLSSPLPMKIAYYMPFKAMGHPHPSGDLIQGTELFRHLGDLGHDCRLISSLRCRWLFLQPHRWPALLAEYVKTLQRLRDFSPDLWLSYHSYYKAPDLLGPSCCRRQGLPYVIFQGIYSTKARKKLKSMPGFYLNRRALTSAQLVFTNKHRDHRNLQRLLPEERIHYVAPGIHPAAFTFDRQARHALRADWQSGSTPLIMTTAMLRPGVKTLGVQWVIEACATLARRGKPLKLVIVGDGEGRGQLESLAGQLLPGQVIFLGRIERTKLAAYYSAADIFAFPGIEESLGMVYLEAQSCGLPVVACADWGGGEAVQPGRTGLLSPFAQPEKFTDNIDRLIEDKALRRQLGDEAAAYIRRNHDLSSTYRHINTALLNLIK